MSLCQSKNSSCGACCGLFNLDLEFREYKKILEERTFQFENSVNFKVSWTIPEYRKKREEIENKIPKKDDTTYNCPFLGYLDSSQKKIGCMIHPQRTGDPSSQNFSFYGASICQGYDCKNKELPTIANWEKFLSNLKLDSVEYSLTSGDWILFKRVEEFFHSIGIQESQFLNLHPNLVLRIIKRNIELKKNTTSFEFEEILEDSLTKLEKLAEYLHLKKEDFLFQTLLDLSIKKKPSTL